MFIPIPLVGIAIAGRVLLSNNKGQSAVKKSRLFQKAKPRHRTRPKPNFSTLRMKREKSIVPNPLQNLFKDLSSTLSRFTQKPVKEDFHAVVKSFLPENAELLTPSYPVHTSQIQFADLDGDSQNELIASYRLGNELTTFILKKQEDRWEKVSEIKNTNHDAINYRNFSDITGEGKKQLLLGYKTKENFGKVHGYSLENGNPSELFTHNYNRIEIIEPQSNKSGTSKAQLAFWNMQDRGVHTIKVTHWNGSELEPLQNQAPYFSRRVLPYYGQRVKQAPQDPSNWYHLAAALTKAEMYRDGLTAIELGMRQNPDFSSKEEFLALKEEILENMK